MDPAPVDVKNKKVVEYIFFQLNNERNIAPQYAVENRELMERGWKWEGGGFSSPGQTQRVRGVTRSQPSFQFASPTMNNRLRPSFLTAAIFVPFHCPQIHVPQRLTKYFWDQNLCCRAPGTTKPAAEFSQSKRQELLFKSWDCSHHFNPSSTRKRTIWTLRIV